MANNTSDLLHYVLNYDKNVVLGMIGDAGAGKSSLINTLLALLESEDRNVDEEYMPYIETAPVDMMGGHTQFREAVDLTSFIQMYDNRGWHDWTKREALERLRAQIGNCI